MEKPKMYIDISGPDGNIYFAAGRAAALLKVSGQENKIDEMWKQIRSGDYNHALYSINQYVQMIDTSQCHELNERLKIAEKELKK